MINYREAESLVVLHQQLDRLFPNRDKRSDGWIGDATHRLKISDHNPWVLLGKIGIVTARDIDKDLNSPPITIENVVNSICRSRDKRVKYIIWNGHITIQGTDLQKWKKYTGVNAHKEHVHISVKADPKFYDSTVPWALPNPK